MEVLEQRPDVTELVKSVAREHSINHPKITNVQTNEKGEGYLGQIFMITIKDSANEETMELVVKAAFKDEVVRKLVPIDEAFINEIYFYTEIYPYFKNFEHELGISKTPDFVPKCYKTINDAGNELICLENLKASSFEIFDKTLTLDHDHVRLIFEMYGRFHAYSFALQDQKPEEYAKLVSNTHNIYKELLKNPNGPTNQHLRDFSKVVETYLVPGKIDDRLIVKFKKYRANGIVEQLTEIVTEEPDYSVILHNDCWSNNMMFKYESSSNGKKPIDMRFLDMQVIGPGSPVNDLSYCLYSGASKKIFDNLNEYLKIYYESLSSFLRKLGSDPQKLFPFDILKAHWRKYSRFGMIMALAIIKMKETKKEDVVDFSGGVDEDKFMEQVLQVKFNEESYKKRITELLQHMVKVDAL